MLIFDYIFEHGKAGKAMNNTTVTLSDILWQRSMKDCQEFEYALERAQKIIAKREDLMHFSPALLILA